MASIFPKPSGLTPVSMLSGRRLLLFLLPLLFLLWSCNRQAASDNSSKSSLLITKLEAQVQQLANLGPDTINLLRENLRGQMQLEHFSKDTVIHPVLQRALVTLDEFEAQRQTLLDTLNNQIFRIRALEHDFIEGRLTQKEFDIFSADEESYSEPWLLGAEYMASRVHAQRLLLETLHASHEKSALKQN